MKPAPRNRSDDWDRVRSKEVPPLRVGANVQSRLFDLATRAPPVELAIEPLEPRLGHRWGVDGLYNDDGTGGDPQSFSDQGRRVVSVMQYKDQEGRVKDVRLIREPLAVIRLDSWITVVEANSVDPCESDP